MTQKVIILQGLPASGKSTWARAHVLANPEFIRVNKDEFSVKDVEIFLESLFNKYYGNF